MNLFKRSEPLSLGARGEKAALNYLKKQGYTILETNYFNPTGRRLGELDIVAKDGEEIVFVEIKTRLDYYKNAPLPEESVTPKKLHKLNKIASFYITKNHLFDAPHRFDTITLLADTQNNCARLRHLKNVFF